MTKSRSSLWIVALLPFGAFAHAAKDPLQVSLVQLIATPERYEGKFVEVSGFLHLEFEGNSFCLHRDDCENHIYANSFWVDASADMQAHSADLNDHYVTLAGKFTAATGLWPGTLTSVRWAYRVPGT